jgi:hypothetical protein
MKLFHVALSGHAHQARLFLSLVGLAVKDDDATASATAFLTDALSAFPFQVTHVLTDRGF